MFYVLTGEGCVWCDRAKELLEEKGAAYTASSFQDEPLFLPLMMMADLNTVPQIWLGREYIGGYTELVKHFAEQDGND